MPDTDAAGDFAATDSITQALGEGHTISLRQVVARWTA
jgi:hypothetical protein